MAPVNCIHLVPYLTLSKKDLPTLRTYAGEVIKPTGQAFVQIVHEGQQQGLSVLVVPGTGPNLLGRDWLAVLKLNWAKVHQVSADDFLKP